MLDRIHWLGHDSFRIDGTDVIYIDPWQLAGTPPPADLVLVTHDHHDHFSPDDIRKIATPGTQIVAPACVTAQLGDEFHTTTVAPGDTVTVRSATITAIPAYNVTKTDDSGALFHPREAGYVGFVVAMDGGTVYHAGDTDDIPEMRDLDVDVALLPVSGVYVMTGGEAAEACLLIKAKAAVPMHYDAIVGSGQDAERMKRLCKIPVTILEREA